MLGQLQQDLDTVQLRTVRRQEEQLEDVACPTASAALHGLGTVDAGMVEHHDERQCANLLTEPVEEGDHVVLPCGALLRRPNQVMVLVERAEYIHALPVRLRLDRMGLARGGPAIRDRRVRPESRLVKVQQPAQPCARYAGQLCNHLFGARKGSANALFLRRTGHACSAIPAAGDSGGRYCR